ncbi:unnamed protein product [Rhizophagus irregularis]|nr:unnamed protein product [Rhizophagus irregularis]
MALALCEKEERVGVTGLEIVGGSTVDGVAGLGISLEFMATFEDNSPEGCSGCFEEEVEDASCDVDVDVYNLTIGKNRLKHNHTKSNVANSVMTTRYP